PARQGNWDERVYGMDSW
nr:immunoglobulin heavy chain junction region [Mus musculus]